METNQSRSNIPNAAFQDGGQSVNHQGPYKKDYYQVYNKVDNGAERTLTVLNGIMLVLGILSVFITIVSAINLRELTGVSVQLVIVAVMILFGTLFGWALIKVFINISNNLHDINSKMR